MKLKLFKIKRMALFLITIVIMLTGCGNNTKIVLTSGFQEGEIFRIDDTCCFDKEAYVYLSNIENQYSELFGEEIWNTTHKGVSLEDNVRNSVLGRLTKVKMMDILANELEIELSSEDLSLVKKAAKEYYNSLNSETISKMGELKEADVKKMYEDYALASKVYNQITSDVDEEVSDDEARTVILKRISFSYNYCDDSGNEIALIDAAKEEKRNQAEAVRNAILEGADFLEMLIENSDSEDEELFYKKGELSREIEDAVFMLGTNEITSVLDDGTSYNIYYCVNPNDSSRTDGTKAEIVKKRKKDAFDQIYNEFSKDKKCYLNQSVWDEIRISTCPQVDSDFFQIYDNYFVSTH